MKHIVWIFTLILGFSLSANAGLLIEPYVGSDSGTATTSYTNGTASAESKATGSAFGARL